MFSKGTLNVVKVVKDNVPSIISQGTHIVGDITTDGEVQVDGTVEGNISCQSLIVAETGEIAGKVTAESVMLQGTLTGTVHGTSVTLSKTARLLGDVTHETLEIEPGARFKGQSIPVDMKKDGVVLLADTRGSFPEEEQSAAEA